MVIDKDNINKDFRDIFNQIYDKNKENVKFQDIFFKEDLAINEKKMEELKPRINKLMNNMIWIMEHPSLFDNKKLFGSLCNIDFSYTDYWQILKIGDNPLYLKLDNPLYSKYTDNTGYSLYIDKDKAFYSCSSSLIIDKTHHPDDVRYRYHAHVSSPEDKYKSLVQIHDDSLAGFIRNFSDWEKDINQNIEKSIDILQTENHYMAHVSIWGTKETDIKKIDEDTIRATLLFEISTEYLYCSSPHLPGSAILTYNRKTDNLTFSSVTVGGTELSDVDTQHIIKEVEGISYIFKEHMFKGIEDSKENDDIER